MRINAYVLAADPAFVEESVASYYDLVDTIVVSYDRTSTSWSGTKLDLDEPLKRLTAVDVDAKMRLEPGDYYLPGAYPLDSDTNQRQHALAQASEGADWVLQLDTDEVLQAPAVFVEHLHEADQRGFTGLEYPARNLYQYVRSDRYLERTNRWGGLRAGYPGPVAVRASTELVHCRQADATLYRVDYRARNTDPAHPHTAPVHAVIGADEGIAHYSWVRGDEQMRRKLNAWGHSNDRDWSRDFKRWEASRRHPHLLAALSRLDNAEAFVRVAKVAGAPDDAALARNGILS